MSRLPRPACAAALFLCGLSAALPARGQSPVPPTPPDTLARIVPIPEITVTRSRQEMRVREAPREVRVVRSEEARDRGSAFMPDYLVGFPEIHVQKTNLGGGAPILRGFSGNRVLILVDGIRLNNSNFRLGPNQYFNTIDPALVDRVEVETGPGSARWGTDALGGVLNVETVAPSRAAPGVEYRGTVTAAEGSTTQSLLVNHAAERWGVVATGTFRRFQDLRAGGRRGVQRPTGFDDASGGAKLVVTPRGDDRLIAAVQYTRQEEVPRTDRVVAGQDSVNLYDPQERRLGYLRYDWRPHHPRLDRLELTVSQHRQLEGRTVIGARNTGVVQEAEDIVDTWGLGLDAMSPLGAREVLSWGGDLYADATASRATTVDRATGERTVAGTRLPDDGERLASGLFARLHRRATDRTNWTAALRSSWHRLSGTPQGPFGHVTLNASNLSGSAEVSHRVGPADFVHVGLAQAFRAPGMEDALATGLTNAGWDVPNPGLEPERSLTLETGLKWNRRATPDRGEEASGRGWSGGVTLWASRVEELIARRPTTWLGSDSLDGEPVYSLVNAGRADLAGASVRVEAVPAAGWVAKAGAAATWGENRETKEPLQRIPPVRGNWSVRRVVREGSVGDAPAIGRAAARTGQLWLELAGDWALRQTRLSPEDRRDNRIPKGGTAGYGVLHLRSGWLAHRDWTLRVALENVLDQNYRVHGSGIDMPGRNLLVGVDWRPFGGTR
jgi:hemoglobin/transferrin/lactoferrin receptor protein